MCAGYRKNQPEPLISTAFPERPWQLFGIDVFHTDASDYLFVLDYLSRHVEVAGTINEQLM